MGCTSVVVSLAFSVEPCQLEIKPDLTYSILTFSPVLYLLFSSWMPVTTGMSSKALNTRANNKPLGLGPDASGKASQIPHPSSNTLGLLVSFLVLGTELRVWCHLACKLPSYTPDSLRLAIVFIRTKSLFLLHGLLTMIHLGKGFVYIDMISWAW